MIKTINAKKVPSKKIIKIILFLPLIIIGLFALFIAGVYATDPIFDRLDHDKFTNLDTQMQSIYNSLKMASGGVDNWNYSTSCDVELAGDFPTGKYYCTALISMEKTVTSVEEINGLQSKYYPIVDKSTSLKQKTELDLQNPNDFGERFVVSSAYKEFSEIKSGIDCSYLLKVNQMDDLVGGFSDNDSYGSTIEGQNGVAVISLRCRNIARDYWYTISNPALLSEPNAPLIKE